MSECKSPKMLVCVYVYISVCYKSIQAACIGLNEVKLFCQFAVCFSHIFMFSPITLALTSNYFQQFLSAFHCTRRYSSQL